MVIAKAKIKKDIQNLDTEFLMLTSCKFNKMAEKLKISTPKF